MQIKEGGSKDSYDLTIRVPESENASNKLLTSKISAGPHILFRNCTSGNPFTGNLGRIIPKMLHFEESIVSELSQASTEP